MKKHYFLFVAILIGIFLLRLPSLFEPFWYGDEGIFAAVAKNLNLGGILYATAWDNKPPMIYLTYAAIFQFFGVSMFWLRLTAMIAVLATAAVIYEIGQKTMGEKRALVATAIFGILTNLRVIEGNLALTEIFMILPISLAFLIVILRKFDLFSLFIAGALFAVGSLFKQVGALEAAALGIFLFLREKDFLTFVVRGFILTCGFALVYLLTLFYFWRLGLADDYIFAAYTYYQIYFDESPQRALVVNILKYSPFVLVTAYGVWSKRKGRINYLNLLLLWGAFSFLGSYFSGRTYGHYLVQAIPALSLLLASFNLRMKLKSMSFAIVLVFTFSLLALTQIVFPGLLGWNPNDQVKYYKNFVDLSTGRKSLEDYNNFFDSNASVVSGARDFLTSVNAQGKSVYIWGDLAWIYAVSSVWNPSRYVTSFHVFGVPNGKEEVGEALVTNPPIYILKPPSSIGYFAELENILASSYTLQSTVSGIDIYARKN